MKMESIRKLRQASTAALDEKKAEDFNTVLNQLSMHLPTNKKININYEYVNKIQSAKGKA